MGKVNGKEVTHVTLILRQGWHYTLGGGLAIICPCCDTVNHCTGETTVKTAKQDGRLDEATFACGCLYDHRIELDEFEPLKWEDTFEKTTV